MKDFVLIYSLIKKSDDRHMVDNKSFLLELFDVLKPMECNNVKGLVRYSITFSSRKNKVEIFNTINEKFSNRIYFQLLGIQKSVINDKLLSNENFDIEFCTIVESFWKRI